MRTVSNRTLDAPAVWNGSNPGIRSSKKFCRVRSNYRFIRIDGLYLLGSSFKVKVRVTLDFIHILGVQDNQRPGCGHNLEDICSLFILISNASAIPRGAGSTFANPSAINSRADLVKRDLAFLLETSHQFLPTRGTRPYGISSAKSSQKLETKTASRAMQMPWTTKGVWSNSARTAMAAGE